MNLLDLLCSGQKRIHMHYKDSGFSDTSEERILSRNTKQKTKNTLSDLIRTLILSLAMSYHKASLKIKSIDIRTQNNTNNQPEEYNINAKKN